jgi:hypothetical protein
VQLARSARLRHKAPYNKQRNICKYKNKMTIKKRRNSKQSRVGGIEKLKNKLQVKDAILNKVNDQPVGHRINRHTLLKLFPRLEGVTWADHPSEGVFYLSTVEEIVRLASRNKVHHSNNLKKFDWPNNRLRSTLAVWPVHWVRICSSHKLPAKKIAWKIKLLLKLVCMSSCVNVDISF